MISGIVDAQVFDPALTSLEDERVDARIEVVLDDSADVDNITFEKDDGYWTVYHYKRFMKIEPSDLHENWTVAEFNASGVFREAVMPVTIVRRSARGPYLEDFYAKFTDARQIVDAINNTGQVLNSCGQYILVPNEAWAKENKVAFRIQHTRHTCIRCFREKFAGVNHTPQGPLDYMNLPVGKPIEVHPKRMIDLCDHHIQEHNNSAMASRIRL